VTGPELMAVWLFAISCTALTVRSVVKLVVAGRTAQAGFRAQVDAHRASVEAQSAPVFVPSQWQEGEL
jgi:hypothetical protein